MTLLRLSDNDVVDGQMTELAEFVTIREGIRAADFVIKLCFLDYSCLNHYTGTVRLDIISIKRSVVNALSEGKLNYPLPVWRDFYLPDSSL